MTYILYYASQDVSPDPGTVLDTWTVYSEEYSSIGEPDPIPGTEVVVSGNLTQQAAHDMAVARQRASYGTRADRR